MPRQPRFLPPGNFYHIMARGNNRADNLHGKNVLAIGTEQFISSAKRKLDYHIKHKDAPYRQK